MKSKIKSWLLILVLLSDEAAAVALVLLALWFFGIEIPLAVTIVAAVLLGVLIFVVHRAVIPALHKKKVTGSEGMIGLNGTVIEPLTPKGIIMAEGEYWKAKSVAENIDVGEEVEILGLGGLTLTVRPKDQ